MSDVVLETRGLSKSYRTGHVIQGRRTALEGLDLTLLRGEILGYVGPNGSGKTTTLKLITGLLRPDRGEVRVFGEPHASRAWRMRVGYLPENPYLYDYLTPSEYLDYVGRLFGLERQKRRERARELLALVGLERSAGVPMRRFSKGMLQRAGLAQALVNDPELLFLDEPMSGLDPIGRRLVRDLILELRRAGKTVLFSTHILSDAETLCDRVAVLRAGRLVKVGSLGELLRLDVAHMEVLASGIAAGTPGPRGRGARRPGRRPAAARDRGARARPRGERHRSGGRARARRPARAPDARGLLLRGDGRRSRSEPPGAGEWGEG